jgi:hypothetical protein
LIFTEEAHLQKETCSNTQKISSIGQKIIYRKVFSIYTTTTKWIEQEEPSHLCPDLLRQKPHKKAVEAYDAGFMFSSVENHFSRLLRPSLMLFPQAIQTGT